MDVKKLSKKYMVILAISVSLLLLVISSLFSWDSNPVMGFDKMCADVLIIMICLIVIKAIGIWETAGFCLKGLGKGLVYGIPFLVIGLGSVVVSNIGVDFSSLKFISLSNAIIFTLNMILVGMNEEIWMRSFVLNGLINKYGDSHKAIWKAIIVSSLIFGGIHIPNIFFMNPITLVVQVVNAAAGGVLFGAIYVKSKNIWAGIIVHAVVDWCSLFVGNCFRGSESVISMEMTIAQAFGIIALGSIPPILIAWWLLRRR